MNAERLTQKSAEAIRSAQQIAQEYGNPQIEQVHLLWALLQDSEGLIPQLLSGMGATVPSREAAVKNLLERQPRVSSSGHEAGKIYISAETETALNRAEKIAGEMKDEYTSVEHLFLGLLETAGRELGSIFSEYRITMERALQALTSVRGNQRGTSDNPEETYGALKKYGSDLVERARQNKLDPVIGRDDEIRNVIRILSRKSKNNPVLIGEPGVDKTAIAEAKDILAKKGVTYSNLWFASDSEAGKFTAGLYSFPTTYVVDKNGNIVGQPIVGGITAPEQAKKLNERIDQALASSK